MLSVLAAVTAFAGTLLLISLFQYDGPDNSAGWNAVFMLPESAAAVAAVIFIVLDIACVTFAALLTVSDIKSRKALKNSDEKTKQTRFSKLYDIDRKALQKETLPYDNRVDLKSFCDGFRAYAASEMKLYYDEAVIRAFVAAMSCTHLIVLQGISGTGKTSLPFAFGKFICSEASVTPVQPSWKDRSDLLGYYNEFTDSYTETELLCRLYEADLTDEIYTVVLDEMNIARVEYYFAEFLSLLELPDGASRRVRVTADSRESDPALFSGGTLALSDNVYFVGTANNDDSTLALSDKVCDRAFIIELNSRSKPFTAQSRGRSHISYSKLRELFAEARTAHPMTEQMKNILNQFDEYLIKAAGITFGNRVMRQAQTFIPVYVSCGGAWEEAADMLICRKILSKMDGLDPVFCRGAADGIQQKLDSLFGEDKMPLCTAYLKKFKAAV